MSTLSSVSASADHKTRNPGSSLPAIDNSTKLRRRLHQAITTTERSADLGHLRGRAGQFKADALFLQELQPADAGDAGLRC